MEKYKFLLKPAFYISSLLASCWMVFALEKLSPSDFGKYESWFHGKPVESVHQADRKKSAINDRQLAEEKVIEMGVKNRLNSIYDQYMLSKKDSTGFVRAVEELISNEKSATTIVHK